MSPNLEAINTKRENDKAPAMANGKIEEPDKSTTRILSESPSGHGDLCEEEKDSPLKTAYKEHPITVACFEEGNVFETLHHPPENTINEICGYSTAPHYCRLDGAID